MDSVKTTERNGIVKSDSRNEMFSPALGSFPLAQKANASVSHAPEDHHNSRLDDGPLQRL